MTRAFAFGLIGVVALGCGAAGAVKDSLERSRAVTVRLESSVGEKSLVGIRWSNGSFASVDINFETVPAGKSVEDVVEAAKAAVAAEFKYLPRRIVVAFSVKP